MSLSGAARRRKGHQFERDVVNALKDQLGEIPPYDDIRRNLTQVRDGDDRGGDVEGIDGWHIECKNHARIMLTGWLDQARRSCGEARPTVIYKKPGGEVRVVIELTLAEFADVVRST